MNASRRGDLAYSLDEREAAPTFHFMLKCLLYSRLQTGLVSNRDYYDEDVNVYVAHLLQAFINPDYIDRVRPYLSQYDADVFLKLARSTDARLKYTIYKTNADFLLISMGLFDDAVAVQPDRRVPANGERSWAAPSEEAYVGRGRTYYRFAYTFSQQLPRRNGGVSDVLEKLAVGFDRYIKILSHMRGEYFDLMTRLSKGEVFHLQRCVNEEARRSEVKEKQDRLLDLYTSWQQSHDADTWRKLQETIAEIKALDPGFSLNLPEA
jgi:hypothetical protein